MFIDARNLPDGQRIECDICVVGAGAAGISFAREFLGQSLKVCLVESGGLEYDATTQQLYEGLSVGRRYFPLAVTRLRFFGGTTNHWVGNSRPFTEWDFQSRSWIPNSGWPINRSELDPYYQRAAHVLDISPQEWALSHWKKQRPDPPLTFASDRVGTRVMASNPLRMGQVYHDELSKAENVDVYLRANVVELQTDEWGQVVTRARIHTLTNKQVFVLARFFVLATGGIENPRILLSSDKVQKNGLGNQNDVVGRYFMDHTKLRAGVIKPLDPGIPMAFYKRNAAAHFLSEETQRKEKITGGEVFLSAIPDESYTKSKQSEGSKSFSQILHAFRKAEIPDNLGQHIGNVLSDIGDVASVTYQQIRYGQIPIGQINCEIGADPVPNPESRVSLSDERDKLGLRRVKLDWRLTPLDKKSARRIMEILGVELGRAHIGRLKSFLSEDDETWPDSLTGHHHHIGTTRMADDPNQGVVDGNCRVHGVSNLYVAGSSVFPTAGLGSPTLMIVALAIRLADHIKGNDT